MLNPETSSLSPSEKSKGARLVSARQEINHMIIIGGKKIKFKEMRKSFKESLAFTIVGTNKRNVNETS